MAKRRRKKKGNEITKLDEMPGAGYYTRDAPQRPDDPTKRYRIIWIGIDQSYKRTGVSVLADDDRVLMCKSVGYDNKSKSYVRKHLTRRLRELAKRCKEEAVEVGAAIERIRVFSHYGGGRRGPKATGLSMDYIMAMSALDAYIADMFGELGIPLYSIDTRAWKSRIVGTPLPQDNEVGCPPKKWPTVQWAMDRVGQDALLIPLRGNSQKRKDVYEIDGMKYMWDTDAADSLGIAQFAMNGYFDLMKRET